MTRKRLLLVLPIVVAGLVAYLVGIVLVIFEFLYNVLYAVSDWIALGRWSNPTRQMEYKDILALWG